jgi:predicted permease
VCAFTFVRQANVAIGDESLVAAGMAVSDNYFSTLAVPMAIGRGLDDRDDRATAEPAVVLSHGFWQRGLGGDPSALGRSIRINGHPFTVAGITAPEYFGVSKGGFFPPADITVALQMHPRVVPQPFGTFAAAPFGSLFTSDQVFWLRIMARVKSGVRTEQVESRMSAAFSQLMAGSELPALRRAETVRVRLLHGARGLDSLRGALEQPLYILAGVGAIVFLIACVNLASLILVRGVARQHELWVRQALGASRARLVRQTFTESLLLSLAGGVAGVLMAAWGGRLLLTLLAGPRPVALRVPLDMRLLILAAVVSCLAGLLFGLLPAMRLASATARTVRPAGLGAASPRLGLGRLLIALQIAVSLPLLVGAVMFGRTLQNLTSVELGFDPKGLLIFSVNPSLNAYSQDDTDRYFDRLLDRLRRTPGVTSAALVENVLVGGLTSNTTMVVDGSEPRSILFNHVSPGFFESMRIPLVEGRTLDPGDGRSAPRVAVISESAARERFGGRALGRRFTLQGFGRSGEYEVVGVVRDSRYASVRGEMRATAFLPVQQSWLPQRSMSVAVRIGATAGAAESVRRAVADVNRDVPITDMKTQLDQIAESMARERLFATLLTFFGGFALLLACIGLHGITAYAVTRRTGEIGLRLALGAQRAQVLWLVLRQVVVLAAVGLVIGIPVAGAATRTVRSLLFNVQPGDPMSLITGAIILMLVAVASGLVPAIRASRLDPLKALRTE